MITASRFILDIAKANLSIDKKPFRLNLYITDRCNCRCKICSIWKKNTKELSSQEWNRFFKKNKNFSWINLTGGEIFLREDIKDIFKVMAKNCKNLHILNFPTNGYLTEKIVSDVKFLKKIYKKHLIISISIDGPEKLHNKLKGKDIFKNAINTYIQLKKINKKVFFSYTMSRYNQGMLKKTYIELKKNIPDLKIDDIHLNLAQESELYYHNKNKIGNIDKNLILKDIDFALSRKNKSIINWLEIRYLKLLKRFIKTGRYPYTSCSAGTSSITINPEGKTYPCLFYNKPLNKTKKPIILECPHCWSACEAFPTLLSTIIKK